MNRLPLVVALVLTGCFSGSQHPTLREVCRDAALGATAIDVIVNTLAATMDPHAPAQDVFSAIDALDTKFQSGAEACSHNAARRMRPSERLRRMLAARAQ